MNRKEPNAYITIKDVLAEVDVTDRTIRNWVALGLIAKPKRISRGYRRGVIGLYPRNTIEKARLLKEIRYLPVETRKEILERANRPLTIDDDGNIIVKYKPTKKSRRIE